MGKATIVSGGTDGLYTIQRQYDETKFQADVAQLTAQIAGLDQAITALEDSLDALGVVRNEKRDALDVAISAYTAAATPANPNPEAELAAFSKALAAFNEADGVLRNARWQIATYKANRTAAQKRLDILNAAQAPGPESAWCADYTEDAAGEVATIEVPGEPQQALVVFPQFWDDSAYTPARDGIITPREWMSPEQAYFNAAILPGWQKFKPTYRTGVITSINREADTCNVTLDAALSSAENLNVNQASALTDVPIAYMTCNAGAFEEDDPVIVKFAGQDWGQPSVVGFVSNPRPCRQGGFIVLPADDTAPTGWPDGSGNAEALVKLEKVPLPPTVRLNTPLEAGDVSWYGSGGRVLTYSHGGVGGRYGAVGPLEMVLGGYDLFLLGARIPTDAMQVLGAAIFDGWLFIVARDANAASGYPETVTLYAAPSPESSLTENLTSLTPTVLVNVTWTAIGQVAAPAGHQFGRPWFFSPTGGEAQTVCRSAPAQGEDRTTYRTKLTLSPGLEGAPPSFAVSHVLYGSKLVLDLVGSATVPPPPPIELVGYEFGPWQMVNDDGAAVAAAQVWVNEHPGTTLLSANWAMPPDFEPGVDYAGFPIPHSHRISKVYFAGRLNEFGNLEESYGDGLTSSVRESRKALMILRIPDWRSHLKLIAEGTELLAVDYDVAGQEVLVELRSVAGRDRIDIPDERVTVAEYAPIYVSANVNGAQHARGNWGSTESIVAAHTGSAGSGFATSVIDRSRAIGEVALQLTANGDVIVEASTGGADLVPAYQETQGTNGYTIDNGNGFFDITGGISSVTTQFHNTWQAPSRAVIDFDARSGHVLTRDYTLSVTTSDGDYTGLPRVKATATATWAPAVRRDNGVALASGGVSEPETTVMDGTTDYHSDTFYEAYFGTLLSYFVWPGGGDQFTQTARRAHLNQNTLEGGRLAVHRGGKDLIASFVTGEATPQHVVYAEINGAGYNIAAEFEVPSQVNFRLHPVKVV